MKNYNYNKKLRQSVNKVSEIIKEKLGFPASDNSVVVIPKITLSNKNSQEENNIFDNIKKMVCYSDLYTNFALDEKCNSITYEDKKNFEILKKVSSFDEWESIYEQSTELHAKSMEQVLYFYNSSAFHKILRIKCLSEKDINQIEKINTIFNQDIEEYSINVNVDYIINKILKIIKSGYKEQQILNESAEFIGILDKIDKKLYKRIMLELIKRDILVSNYIQICEYNSSNEDAKEKLKGILTKLQIYKDLENYIEKINFQHIKSLLNSSIFYHEYKEEIDKNIILKENIKILEKVKEELSDK